MNSLFTKKINGITYEFTNEGFCLICSLCKEVIPKDTHYFKSNILTICRDCFNEANETSMKEGE